MIVCVKVVKERIDTKVGACEEVVLNSKSAVQSGLYRGV